MFGSVSTTPEKLLQMFAALLLFAAVLGIVLFIASRIRGKGSDRWIGYLYLLPVLLMLSVGLVYPGLRTIYESFFDAHGSAFIGVDNYKFIFTSGELRRVLGNTMIWVVLVPFLATAIGLVYSILVDKSRFESFAKALVFLPMAISMVAAGVIWKFMYEYRVDQPKVQQIGLINQIIVWLGGKPVQLLITDTWGLNTLLLIVVFIWIQAGFAMTVLSAAVKAIPDDIIEAARLDGVNAWTMFVKITLPSVRPTIVVVLTTIAIGTLKVFDVVRTMTGGNFNTSVIANEFYSQLIRADNQGLAAALAVILFVLVTPIVIYNIRSVRQEA